jgi:heat shock protein HtpX
VAARRWYGRDGGLTTRMTLTLFGLGLIYVLFIGALIAAGVGAVFVLVIAAAFALVQIFFGDKIALASMRARITEPDEAPELHGMIERLCQLSDLPKPRVAVADSDIPNAFAAGHNSKSATVCVTTGIMQRLEPRELEGVLAHELSHIANRDVIVMTIAGFLATVAGLLVRMGVYSGMMGGGRRDSRDNSAAVFMIVVLVSVVVYVLSFLLLRALSRYREYAADRGAAIMTGSPAQLASALAKISGTMDRVPTKDLRAAEGMNAFFIIPAVAKGFSLSSLVSTHPPVEKRIERLMAMQATLDASPAAAL